ncbi:MAG: hypothetical protein ACYS14_15400 [Planctomycetota bacterium]
MATSFSLRAERARIMRYRNRVTLTAILSVILLAIMTSQLTMAVQAADAGGSALARKLVDAGGVDRGLCAVIGGPRELPVQIAQCSNWRKQRASALTGSSLSRVP